MTTQPGTYRVVDNRPVAMADAKAAWVPIAREALLQAARAYNGIVHYQELAEEVQERSGIRTRQLLYYWIGEVLGRVSDDCVRRGEPLLSALCVRQDGTIGDGFGIAWAAAFGGPAPEDLEVAAAEERLRCYRFFGAVGLPEDGGRPALTPAVASKRRAEAKRRREDVKRPVCPTCFLELPATGQCDLCD